MLYIYTSEKGTDITLKDRKNEFITKNLSLCEKNCQFKHYKYEVKKALCECEIKIDFHLISEIIQNKDKLINIIFDITNLINLELIKCIYLLFSTEGFKYNIGSYIILVIILNNIILLFFYIFKGKYYISKDIDKINIINKNNQITSNNIISKPDKNSKDNKNNNISIKDKNNKYKTNNKKKRHSFILH